MVLGLDRKGLIPLVNNTTKSSCVELEEETFAKNRVQPNRLPRILLVEDEKPIRDIVVLMLLCAGFDCREAASGQAAIDLLASGVRINLVLSNLLLPEVDGFTLLLHVKKHYPCIPFVFVTAVNDGSVKEAAMRNGAEDFLLKPFQREELLAVVRRVLG